MKIISSIVAVAFLLSSCSRQMYMTRHAVENQDRLMDAAKKIFSSFGKDTLLRLLHSNNPGLSKSEFQFLKHTMKFTHVYVSYYSQYPSELPIDSVVIFKRYGTILVEYSILVDMRKQARDNISTWTPDQFEKLGNRIYFLMKDFPFS
jgi:hypothetical protein